ncbi:MAG TPA: hypothetical protein DDW84_01080 [Phycisphaerales bacterium]|nr:MAG: hypothetical protein A2Y13_12610 [Planctomycetes bacterium GWC2_45_44]HBG77430.1 hypothetical protein [Phycisphaerales bacterium]HBR20598.1 hypothetical protein [Phycisphaerales bacterium]
MRSFEKRIQNTEFSRQNEECRLSPRPYSEQAAIGILFFGQDNGIDPPLHEATEAGRDFYCSGVEKWIKSGWFLGDIIIVIRNSVICYQQFDRKMRV